MRYGFIGLGNLGGHLAASLLRNGFELAVNDIDRMSAEPLIRAGARWASTPSALGTEVDCVITCLPSPAVSETVLKEVLQTLKPGSTWIEMSTLGRDEILGLALIAAEKDVRTLECPVTGGVHLASSGKVTVLAGGDKNLLERHRAALEAMGSQLFHMGPLGSAAIIKVITNMLAFIHLVADGEALMLARRGGLDLARHTGELRQQLRTRNRGAAHSERQL
jgi:3-hydroxyisobutyrate dehydrogenase